VWAGAANLGVVVVMYDEMMFPYPWRQPKYSEYMMLTFSVTTALLAWLSMELIVEGLRRMWARYSVPPAEPRPVSLGVWILAVVLSLFVCWDAKGWVLESSLRRHDGESYTLAMAMVQAVIVVAFDISLIRRIVKLRRTKNAGPA
jgi:uncharacterized membrane protein